MERLLSSKVAIEEVPPAARGIPSASETVVGAVGITERGPIGQAVLCESLEDYERRFGGFTTNADLALAALGFFQNGGKNLWVARTMHFSDVDDLATATATRAWGVVTSPGAPTPATVIGSIAAPFSLASGDRLVVSIEGGADEEVVFEAATAQITSVGPGPFALANGQTLRVRIDGGAEQEIAFAASSFADIATATADELAQAINEQIVGGRALSDGDAVSIGSDSEGTASRVEVTGGSANAVLGFPAGEAFGSGNVGNIRAVTIADVARLLEPVAGVVAEAGPSGVLVLRTVSVGAMATLQSQPAGPAGLGLDSDLHRGSDSGAASSLRIEGRDPGAYANQVEIEVRRATSTEASAFDLFVIEDGVYRERFVNLSMDPEAPRYVETVVNDERSGSVLVSVRDLALPTRPVPTEQLVTLAGGDDGLTYLEDRDFVGSDQGKTGLHALDRVPNIDVVIVPGQATPLVHNAMLDYCEVVRDGFCFAVLDPPQGQSARQIVDYVESTALLLGASEHGAIYWPRVAIENPARAVFGTTERIMVAPSGIIAGVCSRTDAARDGGIYSAPAGIEAGRMVGVRGFETDEVLEEARRDLVYPKRINPLRSQRGARPYIDGSRTLKADGNYPFIPQRRGASFIGRSIRDGLEFARHRNNDESLRAEVQRTIEDFLHAQMQVGAFASRVPEEAFFVDVSSELNNAQVVFSGQLLVEVGTAPNTPAEFVVVRFRQLAEAGGGR